MGKVPIEMKVKIQQTNKESMTVILKQGDEP